MRMRVGLVGCGRLAERGYVQALATAPAELVAVADVDRTRCGRIAPGVPCFGSAGELLAGAPVDLLVVATPTSAHAADAEAASLAGVQALVEKPPAPSALATEPLTRLEPAPWIGFNRRFEPALQAARARLGSGRRPTDLTVELAIDAGAWGAHAMDDGPLLDLGSHAVDLVRWLTGDAVEAVRVREVGTASIELELALERSKASVLVAHDRPWHERVAVTANGRESVVYAAGGALRRIRSRLGLGGPLSLPQLLAAQLREAAAALDGGSGVSALASATDGWHVMQVLDAARRATVVPGRWEPVDVGGGA